eukprot:g14092.t1
MPPEETTELLSALSLAALSARCKLPLLVPLHETARQQYLGRTAGDEVQYLVRSATSAPAGMDQLSGLLSYFTGKIHETAESSRWANTDGQLREDDVSIE